MSGWVERLRPEVFGAIDALIVLGGMVWFGAPQWAAFGLAFLCWNVGALRARRTALDVLLVDTECCLPGTACRNPHCEHTPA